MWQIVTFIDSTHTWVHVNRPNEMLGFTKSGEKLGNQSVYW
jgi:hypothetical protein